jgi:hypothetical protein
MKKLFLASSFAMLIGAAHAQGITRDELKRADLTGKDMDVIVTIVTVPPGENSLGLWSAVSSWLR